MNQKGTSLLIEALKKEGVDTIFGYPGSYVIDIFDELYQQKDIELILPRHEQALVHEADGYARSTGKVGVCLVTSGPGATNLVTGIATANYDSVPLVCFTGQVPTSLIGNDAFQEVDIIGITRSICKYGVSVRNRNDLGRIIKEAFYIARTGKPGPVIVDLPKDIMLETGDDSYPEEVNIRGYRPVMTVHPKQLEKAVSLLEGAKKPLFLVGGGVTIAGAQEALLKLINLTGIPVVSTIMGKGSIPTAHPNYYGNIGMHGSYAANLALNECDVLFSVGTRFNDRITGKINEFATKAKIIHVDIDPASISRNIVVDIPIVADAKLAIEKLLELVKPFDTRQWLQRINEFKLSSSPMENRELELTPEQIIGKINECFQDAIIVTDVGQHQMWTMKYLEMNPHKKLLTSGGLGTMGYGFPAAIGAKLGNPDKQVICISGDGGFQMNIQEMATASALELPMIICIFNNSYLGMVRQWQELFYGKRYAGTCMRYRRSCSQNCMDETRECPPYLPDFLKLAESYGAYGIRVEAKDQIQSALEQAARNKKAPTIIEFIIGSEEKVFPMVKAGSSLADMIIG
ncbi:MAG TPA: biosynthetic-type acetolactate synthase large subunit [Mobilitalea sp.]|nr:biosynthetic-type acetolactate synthase large subunit [Mobilitalea sp.]